MGKLVSLKDGTEVTIREMSPDDVDASLAFFRSIPDGDRAYLRRQVDTREAVVARIAEMESGQVVRLVAVSNNRIVGDGALELHRRQWKAHVGEIRLIVAHEFQGRGLGELLAMELYAVANRRKLEEIVVEIMGSQTGIRSIFERLGFRAEAVFHDFVKDIHGRKQDLIIMRCPLAVLWDTLEDHMAATDWHQRI
jgi:L-amino acid N-acyltransferase YncA